MDDETDRRSRRVEWCDYETRQGFEHDLINRPCRGFRDRQQPNRAWHPVDHVPLDRLLEQHVEHRQDVVHSLG